MPRTRRCATLLAAVGRRHRHGDLGDREKWPSGTLLANTAAARSASTPSPICTLALLVGASQRSGVAPRTTPSNRRHAREAAGQEREQLQRGPRPAECHRDQAEPDRLEVHRDGEAQHGDPHTTGPYSAPVAGPARGAYRHRVTGVGRRSTMPTWTTPPRIWIRVVPGAAGARSCTDHTVHLGLPGGCRHMAGLRHSTAISRFPVCWGAVSNGPRCVRQTSLDFVRRSRRHRRCRLGALSAPESSPMDRRAHRPYPSIPNTGPHGI